MKQTLRFVFALFLAAVIIVVACKKSNNNVTGPTTPVSQLFAGLRSTPQNFTVTAGRDTVINGASGTILHFYPNSFMDVNNNIITSGTVSLQLVEMYKPGDMICNNATTTANGQLLQSGGQIYLGAYMGTQVVNANSYGVSFKQNASSTQNMALFYGNTANSDSAATWSMADTSNHITPGDSTNHNGTTAHGTSCNSGLNGNCYYVFDTCLSFSWINCDYILDTTHLPLTTVSVILPDNSYIPDFVSGTNTQIFLVLPKTNSIILVRGNYNSATNTVSLSDDGSKVPIGWNYELAVITNKNGSYYFYETSGITTSGMTIKAAPGPEIIGDIKDRLGGL